MVIVFFNYLYQKLDGKYYVNFILCTNKINLNEYRIVNIMKFCCCTCFSWIEIIVICLCLVVIFADFVSNVVPCTVKVGPSNCAKKTKTMRWFQRNLQYLVSFTAKNKSSDVLCWARNFEHNLKNHISWVKMCVTLVRFE